MLITRKLIGNTLKQLGTAELHSKKACILRIVKLYVYSNMHVQNNLTEWIVDIKLNPKKILPTASLRLKNNQELPLHLHHS